MNFESIDSLINYYIKCPICNEPLKLYVVRAGLNIKFKKCSISSTKSIAISAECNGYEYILYISDNKQIKIKSLENNILIKDENLTNFVSSLFYYSHAIILRFSCLKHHFSFKVKIIVNIIDLIISEIILMSECFNFDLYCFTNIYTDLFSNKKIFQSELEIFDEDYSIIKIDGILPLSSFNFNDKNELLKKINTIKLLV